MSSGPPWEHRGRGPEQLQSHPPGLVLGNVIDGEPGALTSPGGSRRCSSQPGHRDDSPLSRTLGDRLITQIPGARGSLPPGPPSFLSLPGLPVSPFLTSPFSSLVHSLVSQKCSRGTPQASQRDLQKSQQVPLMISWIKPEA